MVSDVAICGCNALTIFVVQFICLHHDIIIINCNEETFAHLSNEI